MSEVIKGTVTDAGGGVIDVLVARSTLNYPALGSEVFIVPRTEWEAMLIAFADLLEGAKDMRPYVDNYFAEKWEHDEYLERAKAFPLPQEDER